MPEKVSVAIARLCYGDTEHCRVGSWLADTVLQMKADNERIARFTEFPVNRHGSDTASNTAVEIAKSAGADLLVKTDNDHVHDYQGGKSFWTTAFDFWWNNHRPASEDRARC